TPPNRSTAVFTMASQWASELGRFATTSALPPSFSHSAATLLSASALLAQITTLAPAAASVFAATLPNAPVAPVMIAVLPFTLNSESGSLRKSSLDMVLPIPASGVMPREGGASSKRERRRLLDRPPSRAMTARCSRHYQHPLPLDHHATTGATATKMVHTSLVRLTISRISFGPM